MNSLRAPARFVLLFDFAAAGLAAVGLRVAAPRLGSAAQRLPARLGFLADRQVVGLVAVALLAAELVATGAGVETDAGSPYAGYDHPAVVAWLRAQPGRFRIEGAAPDWQPDAAAFHGLHDIYGVHNPLALAAYESFYWSVGERGTPPYNYLGARYVIRPKDDPPAGDPYAAAFTPAFDNDPTLTVYENAGALPLAHVIPRAEVVARPEAAWDAIHAPDWDPAALAYVEGGPPLNYPLPEDAHFSVENVVYEANRLEYTIDVAGPAYLVLSEVYYPGWRATVDGAPAVVYRANTAFRAVYVGEPGTHTVALVFAPASFTLGAALSLLTLAALAAGVTVGVWWRRR